MLNQSVNRKKPHYGIVAPEYTLWLKSNAQLLVLIISCYIQTFKFKSVDTIKWMCGPQKESIINVLLTYDKPLTRALTWPTSMSYRNLDLWGRKMDKGFPFWKKETRESIRPICYS